MGLWGFFKDPFTKELEPKESLTAYPLEKKKISLTSKEHRTTRTWQLKWFDHPTPRFFFWRLVEWCTYLKRSEQVPKSLVLFGPGYLMSQKMACSKYFWKTMLICIRWGYGILLRSFKRRWFLQNPDLGPFCEDSPIQICSCLDGFYHPPLESLLKRLRDSPPKKQTNTAPCDAPSMPQPLPRSAAAGPDASLEDAGRCSWNCWYCCSDLCSFVMILGWFVVLYDERNPARGG